MMFSFGVAALIGALWFAPQPVHLDAALCMAMFGWMLLLGLCSLVRELRILPGGVVVEHLVWRRVYSFACVREIDLVKTTNGASALVRLQFVAGAKARPATLGQLAGDARALLAEVREAWLRGRALPTPEVAALSTDRKLAYAAALSLPTLGLIGAMIAVALMPARVDDVDVIERSVVMKSLRVTRSNRGEISVWIQAEDGRTFAPIGAVDFPYSRFARALETDAQQPFKLSVDRTSWNKPWRPLAGDQQVVWLYAIERAGEVFLTREQSAHSRADDRRFLWGFAALPALCLGLVLWGVFRRGVY
jgi:hypothetical protein